MLSYYVYSKTKYLFVIKMCYLIHSILIAHLWVMDIYFSSSGSRHRFQRKIQTSAGVLKIIWSAISLTIFCFEINLTRDDSLIKKCIQNKIKTSVYPVLYLLRKGLLHFRTLLTLEIIKYRLHLIGKKLKFNLYDGKMTITYLSYYYYSSSTAY